MSLKVLLNRLKRHPAPCISNFCSSPGAVPISFLICLTSLNKMYKFKIPRIIRNEAETDVPMIPPTLLKESNLSLIAEAVAATTIHVTITMLKIVQHLHLQWNSNLVAAIFGHKKRECARRMTEGKECSHSGRTLS